MLRPEPSNPITTSHSPPRELAAVPAGGHEALGPLLASYERLAEVFHEILSEQSLDMLLELIADALTDLVPHDGLTIWRADERERMLDPVLARGRWASEILQTRNAWGEGLTGWAVEHGEPVLANEAQLDPRVKQVPGTPLKEEEALISVPLVARDSTKGALNVYRRGAGARFSSPEFALVQRFAEAAALALDNAEIHATLAHEAQTDSLTGLYNHRRFQERLRAELALLGRRRDSVALLMLDIDDFKRVNDVHGHAVGDEVLLAVAETLRKVVRASDIPCRIGGEEFAVVLPGSDAGDALVLARRLRNLLAGLAVEPAPPVTVSIGVTQAPDHARNPRRLVACAEAAMMAAKARGKDTSVLYDEQAADRPHERGDARSVRSIAHLKLLQTLGSRLNRLNDVSAIGEAIVEELEDLLEYHACRVYVIEGDELRPVALRQHFATSGEPRSAVRLRVGEGIAGRAAATGVSLLVPSTLQCDFAAQVPGTAKVDETQIATPLIYGSRVIGVLAVSQLGVAQFDEDDVRLLEVLSGHAAVALENARLYEAERREAQTAKAMLETSNRLLSFSQELAAAADLDELLERVCEGTASIVASPRQSVWLQDATGQPLRLRAARGYSSEQLTELRAVRLPHAVVAEFAGQTRPFVLGALEIAILEGAPADLTSSRFAVAPLRFAEQRYGCIVAAAPAEDAEFSQHRLDLLSGIGSQAQIALASADNIEQLESTFIATVEALANALEASDESTSSHARQIRDWALALGRELRLEPERLKRLELGALFHDIGKIGIPSHVLTKPGPPTDEEWELLRRHPVIGEQILAPIEQLQEVRRIVRHCHERVDGGGYPDGRAGAEIPIESRIILVCDAFHAMTTDRPYRGRLPYEEARRRLRAGAGSQFDAHVVDGFLRLLARGVLAHVSSPEATRQIA